MIWRGKSNLLRIVQEIEIWLFFKIYMHKRQSDPENCQRCWVTNGSPDFAHNTIPIVGEKNKRICRLVNFAIPADHWVKMKKSKKKKKKKRKKRRQILGSCQRTEKAVEHKSQDNTNCSWFIGHNLRGSRELTIEIGNQWENFKPLRQLHRWDQVDSWQESWRLEETWCLWKSSEKPSASVNARSSQE